MQKLLNAGNHKTIKGEKFGWKTFGLHLAPYKLAGINVCPHATVGCSTACLNTAGRGVMRSVQDARIKKTKWFHQDRHGFLLQLYKEIKSAVKSTAKTELGSCFRLNLTSDLPWENLWVVEEHPKQTFYDYTKSKNRMFGYLGGCHWGSWPENYHLTFSRSEVTEDEQVHEICDRGGNVAIVFRDHLPSHWQGIEVIDGDISDLRFQDPRGVIVGLRAKGLAKKDETGFVIEPT